MIGRLSGVLLEKQPPLLLIDVQGVGYEVQAPMTTFYRLPELGAEVSLHTHFAVSETAQQLFGFAEPRDRQLFRALIKVNGVGPKMALGILSGMEAIDVARCVMDNNVAALVKVPGVGKKTAERLVVEMRDRLKDWDSQAAPAGDLEAAVGAVSPPHHNAVVEEAESALIALGYKPTEAAKVIAGILREQPVTRSEELIRLALRSMVPV
ncbi:Holliday junction branch migration protein RuvA [Exilibacterium tricleocarpae]|uniref:Holliday junction branch migration complex subunit RuvA n=1 Tax=Exilibacterium tricleocarpae TaxID=2591008 RepID=A0A545U9J1_9GAMM|nr:Holliday junction branch migration protein RuvA [Exilibacterium tricleocarpae]TQV86109.1 Holliday junction branch migration protein RuvA [Exilibacterium tricleocarpae]